jgi:peroxiredoxin
MLRAKLAAIVAISAFGAQAATLPRKAPPFAIQTPDGKQIQVSSYKGKVVTLVFILTTCPHCQAATRALSKLQPEYGPKGVQVIESAIDEQASKLVPGFIQNFSPPFPVGYNNVYQAIDFLQHPAMAVPHMPMMAFIDRQGNIVAQYEGNSDFLVDTHMEENFRKQLDGMLKTSSPAKKAPAKRPGASPSKKTN